MLVELPSYGSRVLTHFIMRMRMLQPPTNKHPVFGQVESLNMLGKISHLLSRYMMSLHSSTGIPGLLVSIQLTQMMPLFHHHVMLRRPTGTSCLYYARYTSCAALITIQAVERRLTER
jgi:hypothetical protein